MFKVLFTNFHDAVKYIITCKVLYSVDFAIAVTMRLQLINMNRVPVFVITKDGIWWKKRTATGNVGHLVILITRLLMGKHFLSWELAHTS